MVKTWQAKEHNTFSRQQKWWLNNMSGHWAPAAYTAVGKECSHFSFEAKIVNAKELMLLFVFSWLHARIGLFYNMVTLAFEIKGLIRYWRHALLEERISGSSSEPINRSIYRPHWGLESVLSQVDLFLERAMGALCYPPTRKVVWTVPVH